MDKMPDETTIDTTNNGAAAAQPTGAVRVDAGDATPNQNQTSDWDRKQAQRDQQFRDLQQWRERPAKIGVKHISDFDKIERLHGVLQRRGMTMEQLADIMDNPIDDAAPTHRAAFDEDSILKSILPKVEGRVQHMLAERELEQLSKAETAQLNKMAEELAGDGATARQKQVVKESILYRAAMARQEFEEGHPLHGKRYRPLDEGGLKSLRESIEKEIADEKAAALAEIGDAANKGKPKVSPTAGNSGDQGKPTGTTNKPKTPFDQLSRDDQIAALHAARKRTPGLSGGATTA